MRAYFDKENVASFIASRDNPLFDDCLRMLKSQCDLFFTFPKEVFLSPPYSDVFRVLSSGRSNSSKPRFDEVFPQRPLKANVHNEFNRDQLTAIYLLNDDRASSVKNRGAILIGSLGEEVDTLAKLFFDDYQFSKVVTPKNDMPSWHSLDDYVLPCSDIIIIDRYLFAEKDLLDYNLHPYLEVISRYDSEYKFNLVIFTDAEQKIKINGRTSTIVPDWDELRQLIIDFFKKKYKRASVKVTIVASRAIGEHDRTIFTNYSNHESGDSLCYYDSNGLLTTKCRHYSIHSHGSRDNLQNGFYILDDMQKLINELSDPSKSHCIHGDKVCNFLNFPS